MATINSQDKLNEFLSFLFEPNATSGVHSSRQSRQKATVDVALSGAQLRVDRIAKIQASFGLPIQTLAEVLRISRANLYKWLDVTKEITLQEESVQRLNLIEKLAFLWQSLSKTPLRSIALDPLETGENIINLLSAAEIDRERVEHAFDVYANKLTQKSKSLSQRMLEAGYKPRPTHRSLPSDE
jgi:DNA-binding transcriptional regulator YiaG